MRDIGRIDEPGAERSEWEAEMELLDEELRDSPTEALSELVDLVGRELEGHGFVIDSLDADPNGPVPEFQEARRVAELVEAGGGDASLGDVGDAIHRLRAIHDALMEGRGAA
jgi:Xaa-Pro aminopeptidase